MRPSEDGVSRVVRVIDAAAIRARLQAEGRDLTNRRPSRPGAPGRPGSFREIRVVPDHRGGGVQMVDVTQRSGFGAPGGAPAPGMAPGARPAKPGGGGGRKGRDEGGGDGFRRSEVAERAGARDLWVTPGKKRKAAKRGQETQVTTPAAHKRVIDIQGTIQVGELARQMSIKVGDIIRKLMSMGMMVTMNQNIDFDTAAIVAQEFEFEVKNVEFQEEDLLAGETQEVGTRTTRPPVVTVMGHVDHGKTSLLDAIRSANVAAGEAGGITQHIGAYSVVIPKGRITFLDTPGHEAFTAMRARGAKMTDLVVLVVAADDGVMPQTIEAANHAKAANVPIVVALNKIDKAEANPDRVKQQLAEHGLVPEDWGGTTMYFPVSAKKRTGVDALLDGLLLQAEVMELKADADRLAKGAIVEAQLDKGRGPVATLLVQEGTLHTGDAIVAGECYGRVRAMYDDRGNTVEVATPSTPVMVLGLDGVPNAGDHMDAVADADTAKTVATHRRMKRREKELAQDNRVTLENFLDKTRKDQAKELKLVVKADVQGSVEAVSAALERLSNNQVKVAIVHSGVGAVTESDVNLSAASGAVIIGFGVRPDPKAQAHAEQHHVEIRTYNIIYEAAAEVRAAMEGLLAPTLREKYLGRAEVRQVFQVAKVGQIAGCQIVDGKINRQAKLRLLRDQKHVFEGKVGSLRRFKDDVKEVLQGFECGLSIEGYGDIKVGDVIEAFEVEVIRSKLEGVPDPAAAYRTAPAEARP
ncbi:MAG: translation initiation factor IF-2 [Deltaproteobacteria bacterium]|nr:translation initiation factor IF-2 [Deltaproteobacteria bacterium]